LPRELVERILLLLDTESMLTCGLVNREFNEIIQSSTLLQYSLACKAAAVVDNSRSSLSYAERLQALKKREEAWRKLKPVFEMTIDTHSTTSSICRSTEGVYFMTDDNRKDLNYCHLPSFPQDNPRWIRIPGHGPALDWSGILVNFAAALYEHDLIVNFITYAYLTFQSNMQQHSLDLVFLKFTTGEYHPLARRPRIHVQRSLELKPWVVSRIVGDNLALIIHSRDGAFSDKLIIIDWKTGHKLLQHEATENPYSSLVFVSPELLLVPNSVLFHFEIWHLPSQQFNSQSPIQILSLQIPALSPEYSFFHSGNFGCNGEPNPFLRSMPYLPPQSFFSSPENSIIMVTLRMESNSHPDRFASYNLIMHRHALLDTIQTWAAWASPSLLGQYLTNEWGPPISRWFQVSETHARWTGHSNGQRCAFLEPTPLDGEKSMVSVVNFNSYNFAKNAAMMARLQTGENNGSNGNKGKEEGEEGEFEILDHKGVFSEEVYMGLKCAVYRTPDEYDFDLVLMDEERLLGVKVST
ncbi:hypothetical protein M378DRAFT_86879, partial [Amanita muscaria Koide BX008]